MIKIDLGSAFNKPQGYIGVDKIKAEGVDVVHDCNNPLPFENNYADEIRTADFLEHIAEPIPLMNEIWRVLKPGGILNFNVPDAEKGQGAFQDPTHKSFWVKKSFLYYTNDYYRKLYDIKAKFEILELQEVKQEHPYWGDIYRIIGTLRAIKGEQKSSKLVLKEKVLDIIMPCRFKPEITKVCIDSVNSYTDLPINWIVIQDGQDEEMARVLSKIGVKIYNKIARGWVNAINEGMKYAENDYVLFLNDDVVATPGWIIKMLRHFENNPKLGVIGPVTNQIDNNQHINYQSQYSFEETKELIGYCMLFKKEVLDKLKEKDGFYMDPIFGLGGQDDSDICWRIRELGYQVGIARDTFIYHYGSKAFRQMMTAEDSHKFRKSRIDILRKKWKLPPRKYETKVLICVPSADGTNVIPLTQNLITWCKDTRYSVDFYPQSYTFPMDNARNQCVKKFLAGDWDYLWFIDDDVVPPQDALHRLISADKDIIGATAFSMRSENGQNYPYPVTLKYDKDKNYVLYVGKGIDEVDATGGGCIMYKRHVFEHPQMEKPYEFQYNRDGTLKLTCDFLIHQKTQALGYKTYVDFDLICSHFRQVDIKSINDLLIKHA